MKDGIKGTLQLELNELIKLSLSCRKWVKGKADKWVEEVKKAWSGTILWPIPLSRLYASSSPPPTVYSPSAIAYCPLPFTNSRALLMHIRKKDLGSWISMDKCRLELHTPLDQSLRGKEDQSRIAQLVHQDTRSYLTTPSCYAAGEKKGDLAEYISCRLGSYH